MNTYRIIVRESIEYSIEADTEEEARDLLFMGDQQVVNNRITDYKIITERES
jgi:hypothetical protein